MNKTTYYIPSGVTYIVTKLSLETVEFDGIRETVPMERNVAQVTGPATITVESDES